MARDTVSNVKPVINHLTMFDCFSLNFSRSTIKLNTLLESSNLLQEYSDVLHESLSMATGGASQNTYPIIFKLSVSSLANLLKSYPRLFIFVFCNVFDVSQNKRVENLEKACLRQFSPFKIPTSNATQK